jgi:hypothetical protein
MTGVPVAGGATGCMPGPGGCGMPVGGGCIIGGVTVIGAGASFEHAHSQTIETTANETRPDTRMT